MLLLVIGYGLVLAALTVVLVDVSAVFLARRSMAGTVDGAAVAAAQSLDEAMLYSAADLDGVPLAQEDARAVVDQYLSDDGLADRVQSLDPADVVSDGRSVTVSVTATVRLPVLGVVAAGWADGVPMTVTARARTPFVR